METTLSSTFVYEKSCSANMCNSNIMCQLIKALWTHLPYFRNNQRLYVCDNWILTVELEVDKVINIYYYRRGSKVDYIDPCA